MWNSEWQAEINNKLREIKDSVGQWPSSINKIRKHEVILASLSIGHTHTTHGYLMENDHQKYFDDCIIPPAAKHILVECPSFIEERTKYYGQLAIQLDDKLAEQLRHKFDMNKLVNFVQDINFWSII